MSCFASLKLTSKRHSVSTYEFIRVLDAPGGKADLAKFLTRLESGLAAFRYFVNRPIDVIESHEVTLILKCGTDIVAYGHLEEEDGRLWLGIAVADDSVGQGWGHVMMRELIAKARASSFNKISLRVDLENDAGIGLYKKMGFEVVDERSESSSVLMEKHITDDDAQEY